MQVVRQTFTQEFNEPNLITKLAEDLAQDWRLRLSTDCPEQSAATRESIIRWLLVVCQENFAWWQAGGAGEDIEAGEEFSPPATPASSARPTRQFWVGKLLGKDFEQFGMLNPYQLEIAQQAMEFRYHILRHRYLGLEPELAYRHLMQRLGSLVLIRDKIHTFVALNRDRQRAVVNVLQEVLQELLQRDRYMQQQMAWIAECTGDARLRNALLFASMEEYCLRPIRNQPLLVYRFVNYINRYYASRSNPINREHTSF
jgi:hypothetical protein